MSRKGPLSGAASWLRCSCGLIAVMAMGGIAGLKERVCCAEVGDPQLRTDHPWYPGELACSTFERLAATQAEVYRRVVGEPPRSDEQKALASWLWRNTHYWHGEEGVEDLFGRGLQNGGDGTTREYWTGLFAHGFGLCGTTHAQWNAELSALLGHNRGRTVGTAGHNSFEVYLKGGAYGEGRWALLDHDLSTVIFDREQQTLLSIADIQRDALRLASRANGGDHQRGWLICGLHEGDGSVYGAYQSAEYLAGYSGAPPVVHLRRGESLRRYHRPGLEDGNTFVFWGRNDNVGGIAGPEGSRTWVNQPEKMHGSRDGAGYRPGQARYGNAVYVYRPDFTTSDYREGVVDEDAQHITFEFFTPYIIAATPPNDEPWGIYEAGCRNGLVIDGAAPCTVAVSTDCGQSWTEPRRLADRVDLTDAVKGFRQYRLRLTRPESSEAPLPQMLAQAGLTITTICQANTSTMPRLRDHGTEIEFAASGRAVMSAGPTLPQARAHRIAGDFDTPAVTLAVTPPRGRPLVALHAATHVQSSNPPSDQVAYQIDYSIDAGATWLPMVRDWRITRRGDEPDDFWSQSFCWGKTEFDTLVSGKVWVRFSNNGMKPNRRAEVHAVYDVAGDDATEVTFAWSDDQGERTASHTFAADTARPSIWRLPTGEGTETRWVEMRPKPTN